jgi:hypothetical protein
MSAVTACGRVFSWGCCARLHGLQTTADRLKHMGVQEADCARSRFDELDTSMPTPCQAAGNGGEQGSAGRGPRFFFDPLGGLARPPLRGRYTTILLRNCVKSSVWTPSHSELCADPRRRALGARLLHTGSNVGRHGGRPRLRQQLDGS